MEPSSVYTEGKVSLKPNIYTSPIKNWFPRIIFIPTTLYFLILILHGAFIIPSTTESTINYTCKLVVVLFENLNYLSKGLGMSFHLLCWVSLPTFCCLLRSDVGGGKIVSLKYGHSGKGREVRMVWQGGEACMETLKLVEINGRMWEESVYWEGT